MSASVKQFEVYWYDPSPVIGSEIQKIRPAVIVSPNELNNRLQTVIIAPLTSSVRDWPFRVTAVVQGRQSSVACDQLRAIDKTRLGSKITTIPAVEGRAVLQTINQIFSFETV